MGMGTCDEVHFTCKLSVKGKKAKWYIKNQECYKGPKYSMDTDEENGTYTLTIKNPKMEDGGRYTCIVRECNDLSCKGYLEVEPADPEYGIAKGLKDLKGKTKRKVNFKCKVDNPEAKVKWFHNGKEIKPSNPRYLIKNEGGNCSLEIRSAEMADAGEWTCKIDGEFAKEGKDTTSCKLEMEEFQHAFTSQLQGKNVAEGEKRKLIIKDCKVDDTAGITVKVPGDESSAPLNVKHHNGFKKGMRDFKQCVEREEIVFNVELKDPGAPANFFINGEPVDLSVPRFEVKTLGDGKHQLIIKPVKMGDAGTVSCKTPSNKGDEILESKSSFNVIKGEEAPVMGDCGPVVGTAKKACGMTIPYKVEGEKQSDLEIIVEGPDGKVLKMGKDANLTLHGDRLQLDLINPTREKSGKYKVIMKNAQGSCEKFIDVNIMDKPTPPKTCRVTDVFCDNLVVHWSEPADDGGTPIKKYVVECIDTTG